MSSGVSRSLRRFCDCFEQDFRIGGFGDDSVEKLQVFVPFRERSGEGDETCPAQARIGFDFTRDLQAVDRGHVQIEDDDVRAIPSGRF